MPGDAGNGASLLRKPGILVSSELGPRVDISDAVLALTLTSQVLARCACVLPRKVQFKDLVDAESLCTEIRTGIFPMMGLSVVNFMLISRKSEIASPLGFSRRNQSCFCLSVSILIRLVVHLVR